MIQHFQRYQYAYADMELACDEDVLHRLFGQDYAAYDKTVLNAMIRNKERKSI